MQSNQKASYLFSPLSRFALSDCSSPAAPWFFAAAGLKLSCHTLTFPDTHPGGVTTSAECCGDDLDSHSLGSEVWMKSHFILDVMRHLGQNHQLLELFHLLDECRAEQRSAFRTIKCVLNSEPRCSVWHFSDISGERILQTTPRLGWCFLMNASSLFFFDSLHDRSCRRQALSAFLILTFSSSWGWTWLAPAHPAPGEMTHSLWASDWPTSSYTQSLWHDTAHLNGSCSLFCWSGCCRRDTRDLYMTNPRSGCVSFFPQKSSPKKGYIPFSRCLTEVGLHDAFVWLCETQRWTRGSVNVQCLEKKGQKRYERNFEMYFFFFLHFPGEGQNLYVTLSAVCR